MAGSLVGKKRNAKTQPTIQVAPFIDVVLVLLIIFMITTPIIVAGFDISLPEGAEDASSITKDEPIAITYTKEQKIYVGEELVSGNNMVKLVLVKTGADKNRPLFIRSDKAVPYGNVMQVINILNRAGYKRTILVTENA